MIEDAPEFAREKKLLENITHSSSEVYSALNIHNAFSLFKNKQSFD